MSNEIDDLKNLWRDSRNIDNGQSIDPHVIIAAANKKMRSTIVLQLGTIIILILTLVGISAFFIYVARFKETLSHIGCSLMVGGLALRILIEVFSIYLSSTIRPSDLALKASKATLFYYRFRQIINGPVTWCILVLYTIGFYMLTPEFSIYLSTVAMIMIDLSYVVGAVIVAWFIQNTVKKEMKVLSEVLRIHEDIIREE